MTLARQLHNTYLDLTENSFNKKNLKNIPNLSEECYNKIVKGVLNIMYNGTYINHETGETLFFKKGRKTRVINEGKKDSIIGGANPFGGVPLPGNN